MKTQTLPKSLLFGALLSVSLFFAHLPAALALDDDGLVQLSQIHNGHTRSVRMDQIISITLDDANTYDNGTNYWAYVTSVANTLHPIMKQYSEFYAYSKDDPTSMTPVNIYGERTYYFSLLQTGKTVVTFIEHNPADTDGLNDQGFTVTLLVTPAAPAQ